MTPENAKTDGLPGQGGRLFFCCGEKSGKVRFCNFFEHFPENSSSVIRQNNEKPRNRDGFRAFDDGARYRTRTCDPMHVKHVLYQLS